MLVYLLICLFACFKVHYYVGKLQVDELSFYYIYVCVTMTSVLPNNRRLWTAAIPATRKAVISSRGRFRVRWIKGAYWKSVYPLIEAIYRLQWFQPLGQAVISGRGRFRVRCLLEVSLSPYRGSLQVAAIPATQLIMISSSGGSWVSGILG